MPDIPFRLPSLEKKNFLEAVLPKKKISNQISLKLSLLKNLVFKKIEVLLDVSSRTRRYCTFLFFLLNYNCTPSTQWAWQVSITIWHSPVPRVDTLRLCLSTRPLQSANIPTILRCPGTQKKPMHRLAPYCTLLPAPLHPCTLFPAQNQFRWVASFGWIFLVHIPYQL